MPVSLAETEMGPMIIQEAMATLKPPRPLVLFKAPCCKPQPRVSCPDPEVTISTIQLVSLSITCIVRYVYRDVGLFYVHVLTNDFFSFRLDLTPNPPALISPIN